MTKNRWRRVCVQFGLCVVCLLGGAVVASAQDTSSEKKSEAPAQQTIGGGVKATKGTKSKADITTSKDDGQSVGGGGVQANRSARNLSYATAKGLVHTYLKGLNQPDSSGWHSAVGLPNTMGDSCAIAATMDGLVALAKKRGGAGSVTLGSMTQVTDVESVPEGLKASYVYLSVKKETCSGKARVLQGETIGSPRVYYMVDVTGGSKGKSTVLVRLTFLSGAWKATGFGE